MKLTKKQIRALENVFAAELEHRLPFQSKARIYADLADADYLQPYTRIFGAGERFAVTVSGYALTHAGHYAYCMQCPAPGTAGAGGGHAIAV